MQAKKSTQNLFNLSLMTIRKWHWMSAALCFVCMLMFAVTGITLHHAKVFLPDAKITHITGNIPEELARSIQPFDSQKPEREAREVRGNSTPGTPVPKELVTWFNQEHHLDLSGRNGDIRNGKYTVMLSRPGVNKTLSINSKTVEFDYEVSDRGWLAYLNDLHKGKNTGMAWVYFIDMFAIACIIFSITGFLLLQRYANTRAQTWPLLTASLLLPVFFMVFLIH